MLSSRHMEAILLRLISEHDRYGYELFNEISTRTDQKLEIKEATLYAVLQRLQKQELISSYQGEVSNGSKRRYYHITTNGKTVLEREMAEWQEMKKIINLFLEDKENDTEKS